MVEIKDTYDAAKSFISDIYKAYKSRNINDLIPFIDGLVKDTKISNAQELCSNHF